MAARISERTVFTFFDSFFPSPFTNPVHQYLNDASTCAIVGALEARIAANPDQVEKARVNAKLAGWFTGQVLKSTGGKANPAVVNAMVAQKLGL